MKTFLLSLLLSLIASLLITSHINAAEKVYKVSHVVDGDTITVIDNGKSEVVRLLGIDTPETKEPRKPVQCFGQAATDKMKSFVQGMSVILVSDETQGNRDKYNRLLRYVYLPNSTRTFVNGEMVKQGYAFSFKEYPTKMLQKFNAFEKYARENNLGLWGSCPISTLNHVLITPIKPAKQQIQGVNSGSFTCNCSKTCAAMSSCAEAQFQLNNCGCSARDADHDGIACDAQCQ